MRKMRFISPSSFGKFKNEREEFYLMYLSDLRPDKIPQTRPMAIGSAFDAYIKAKLSADFNLGLFDVDTLMATQVEDPANLPWCYENGQYLLDCYVKSGAYADLHLELEDYKAAPQMEYKVEGMVGGVPLLGKPDLTYTNKSNTRMIKDFKVNGYCSKSGASPAKGYVKIRDGWDGLITPHSKSHGTSHKEAIVVRTDGVMLNIGDTLDAINEEWARQISIYAWVKGEPVGGDFIAGIEQLACKNVGAPRPLVRVASFRNRVGAPYQHQLLRELQEMWEVVNSDYIFRNLSYAESLEKQKQLDARANTLVNDPVFASLTRE